MRAATVGLIAFLTPILACDDLSGPGETAPPRGVIDARTGGDPGFYAGGRAGTILHYDGSEWSHMASPVAVDLRAVWGRSGRDVYAAGDDGTLLHYDGAAWRTLDSGTTLDLLGIGGARGHVLVVGEAGLILVGSGSRMVPAD